MYADEASYLLCRRSGFSGLYAVGGRTNSDKSLSSGSKPLHPGNSNNLEHYEIKSGRWLREWAPVGANQILEL
jgi:hypothetical protein